MNIAARLALANLLFVQGNHASALERQVAWACMCICMDFHVYWQLIAHPSLQSCNVLLMCSKPQSSCSITRLGANLVFDMCCRYQEAIRLHPGCPAEVRLGLAACYFRLGQLERAKKAYERVVQLSPTCAEALYGLAVLRFSSSQGESAKAVSGQPCFQQAYNM